MPNINEGKEEKRTQAEDIVSLALLATSPIPTAPLIWAGGEVWGSWWSETGAGVFRHGCAPPGTYKFTPLFTLKRIRKKTFLSTLGMSPASEDKDLWEDPEPWGAARRGQHGRGGSVELRSITIDTGMYFRLQTYNTRSAALSSKMRGIYV
ncbi:hypothetical protein C8R44DRAFT_886746 [Mycena epipterygia]|nr:hypothetical protein C8R44DRAFT_886746 [Mycena epipterygia]